MLSSPQARFPRACVPWISAGYLTVLAGSGGCQAAERESSTVHFTRVTEAPFATDRASTGSGQWMDITGGGHLDLFVSNGYDVSTTPVPQPNRLYLNDGAGRLVPTDAGPLTDDAVFASGATWGDFDNDGHVDVFTPAQRGEFNRLYRNVGGGAFVPVAGPDRIDPRSEPAFACTHGSAERTSGSSGSWSATPGFAARIRSVRAPSRSCTLRRRWSSTSRRNVHREGRIACP